MPVDDGQTTAPATAPLGRGDRVTSSDCLDVVAAACRAPSIHNTQPWSWRVEGSTVELYADQDRRLPQADPHGRDLLISCGAALHHAQVAARARGWDPVVERWPRGAGSDLLARLTLAPRHHHPTASDAALLKALLERRTDRRRFTSWPVHGERLERLSDVARAWGADAVVLHDVVDRFRVEHLVSRAHAVQSADPALVEEQRRRVDRSSVDGVPPAVVPADGAELPSRRPRFAGGLLEVGEPDVETTDGVVVVCGETDDPDAWLTTGEALGAVWLHAVGDGLAIVPLSQVVEVDGTRAALRHEVLLGVAFPHLLLRVGWRPLGSVDLPRTPRRPLEEVLRTGAGSMLGKLRDC